jgi:hypothetical protein
MTVTELHPHAVHAIRAAANWHVWGRDAAIRYCRNHGVSIALLRLARQLHVATMVGF